MFNDNSPISALSKIADKEFADNELIFNVTLSDSDAPPSGVENGQLERISKEIAAASAEKKSTLSVKNPANTQKKPPREIREVREERNYQLYAEIVGEANMAALRRMPVDEGAVKNPDPTPKAIGGRFIPMPSIDELSALEANPCMVNYNGSDMLFKNVPGQNKFQLFIGQLPENYNSNLIRACFAKAFGIVTVDFKIHKKKETCNVEKDTGTIFCASEADRAVLLAANKTINYFCGIGFVICATNDTPINHIPEEFRAYCSSPGVHYKFVIELSTSRAHLLMPQPPVVPPMLMPAYSLMMVANTRQLASGRFIPLPSEDVLISLRSNPCLAFFQEMYVPFINIPEDAKFKLFVGQLHKDINREIMRYLLGEIFGITVVDFLKNKVNIDANNTYLGTGRIYFNNQHDFNIVHTLNRAITYLPGVGFVVCNSRDNFRLYLPEHLKGHYSSFTPCLTIELPVSKNGLIKSYTPQF